MNFTSLSYFEMLARERSFTRAAQQLHITQQSLSSNIAKMESELGCQLIVRHVPLELTYAGEVLLRYAESFREEYTALQQEFCDISQNQRGVLRIGVTYTRGRTIMPDIIQEFQQRFPAIRIDLVESTNDVLHRLIAEGDVDVSIANYPAGVPGVVLREFYHEEVVMLVSRKLFSSLYGDEARERAQRFESGDYSAIDGCPLVLNNIDDIGGHVERNLLKRAGIAHPLVMATSTNVETLLALCVRGVGACFCPEILARAALTEAQFSSLLLLRLGEQARYPICFGYQERSYQWSIVDSFIETAQDAFARLHGVDGVDTRTERAGKAGWGEDIPENHVERERGEVKTQGG